MVAMMAGPPQSAALHRQPTPEGEEKLSGAACLKSAVGKVAMKECGYGEHAEEIKKNRQTDSKGTGLMKKSQKGKEVQENEGKPTAGPRLYRKVQHLTAAGRKVVTI